MSSRWALLTGMVRDESAYLRKLAILRRWMERGLLDGVCVSAWIGELDRYPQVAAELASMGANVVESREMDLLLPGSFFHQVRSIRAGLLAIPQGALVFRMRSDKCVLGEEDHVAFDRVIEESNALPWCRAPFFDGRVVVPVGHFLTPFFLYDPLICARRETLMRLARLDATLEAEGSEIIPEQMLHGAIFARENPVLDLFFRVHRLACFRTPPELSALVNAWFTSPLFLEAMAVWLCALDTHFHVGFHPSTGDWSHSSLGDAMRGCPGSFLGFDMGIGFDRGMNSLHFGSDGWVGALLRGEFAPDLYGRRLLRARDRVAEGRATRWPSEDGRIPQEAVELELVQNAILGGSGKIPADREQGGLLLAVDGPRWKFR